jgi:hypothetical protein
MSLEVLFIANIGDHLSFLNTGYSTISRTFCSKMDTQYFRGVKMCVSVSGVRCSKVETKKWRRLHFPEVATLLVCILTNVASFRVT